MILILSASALVLWAVMLKLYLPRRYNRRRHVQRIADRLRDPQPTKRYSMD